MIFYNSDCLGNPKNTYYSNRYLVNQKTLVGQLRNIFSKDYVCATYRSNKRDETNFISSDILAFDCDNDHSDNSSEWITPDEVKDAFDDVFMIFHMSRNHMKEKDGKSARPRFHVFMWMREIKDPNAYKE